VRFTQAFLDRGVPVASYTGLDVYTEMIDFLRENVRDSRFDFRAVDLHNERYNSGGAQLAADTRFPVAEHAFDVVCLFSVFTHLEPGDAEAMLRVLRRHVAPNGQLFFTLYLDETTPGGHGLMDGIARTAGPDAVGKVETFRDLDPERPLFWAVYAQDYARRLVERTGWVVRHVGLPDPDMQHHFVCAPV
jgi:SAM-dependent methyltransferase